MTVDRENHNKNKRKNIMKEYNIVGRYKDNFNFNPEIIDTCVDDEKDYLLNEYRISFGNDWDLWLEEINS
tara:strand:- start:291 stop:500 length:210 start_codon:yes stop_codon:yes gene_type:complete